MPESVRFCLEIFSDYFFWLFLNLYLIGIAPAAVNIGASYFFIAAYPYRIKLSLLHGQGLFQRGRLYLLDVFLTGGVGNLIAACTGCLFNGDSQLSFGIVFCGQRRFLWRNLKRLCNAPGIISLALYDKLAKPWLRIGFRIRNEIIRSLC